MKSKKCTKCGEVKNLDKFHRDSQKKDGLRPDCKVCQKSYRKSNSKRIAKVKKEYREKNRERLVKNQKDHYRLNRDRIIKRNNEYYMKKRGSDAVCKLKHELSKQIRMALMGTWKYTLKSKGYPVIGLSYIDLVGHLWNTFEENYGIPRGHVSTDQVQVDHIIPLATANTQEDVRRLNHYTNLQLLFKQDNMDKRTKVDE